MKRSKSKSLLPLVMALAIALSLLFLGACGSSDTPATEQGGASGTDEATATTAAAEPSDKGPSKIIEPSELVSQEEASLIMGETLDEVGYMDQDRVGLKQNFYTSSESGAFFQITITQQAFMDPEQSMTPEGLFRALGPDQSDAVEVEGVGDEAWFATPGLHILVGDYYLLVAVGDMSIAGNEEVLKEGGQVAVENLRALIQ